MRRRKETEHSFETSRSQTKKVLSHQQSTQLPHPPLSLSPGSFHFSRIPRLPVPFPGQLHADDPNNARIRSDGADTSLFCVAGSLLGLISPSTEQIENEPESEAEDQEAPVEAIRRDTPRGNVARYHPVSQLDKRLHILERGDSANFESLFP